MITVFYDGKCGLCSKEINYYRKIAPLGVFVWQDINQLKDQLAKEGLTLSEGLKILHVKDDKGKLHKGVAAFILIWQQLPAWRLLAIIIALPLIRQTANLAYQIFANWRFKRLDHCQIENNNITSES